MLISTRSPCKTVTRRIGFYTLFVEKKWSRFFYWFFEQLFSQLKLNHSRHPTDTNTPDAKVISVGVINKITPGPEKTGCWVQTWAQKNNSPVHKPLPHSEKAKVASSTDFSENWKLRRTPFWRKVKREMWRTSMKMLSPFLPSGIFIDAYECTSTNILFLFFLKNLLNTIRYMQQKYYGINSKLLTLHC